MYIDNTRTTATLGGHGRMVPNYNEVSQKLHDKTRGWLPWVVLNHLPLSR